jgi:hypothetical protein
MGCACLQAVFSEGCKRRHAQTRRNLQMPVQGQRPGTCFNHSRAVIHCTSCDSLLVTAMRVRASVVNGGICFLCMPRPLGPPLSKEPWRACRAFLLASIRWDIGSWGWPLFAEFGTTFVLQVSQGAKSAIDLFAFSGVVLYMYLWLQGRDGVDIYTCVLLQLFKIVAMNLWWHSLTPYSGGSGATF